MISGTFEQCEFTRIVISETFVNPAIQTCTLTPPPRHKQVCASRRPSLQHHKLPFAHDVPFCADLRSAVRQLRPTALIGVSTIGGAFKEEVIRELADMNVSGYRSS